MKYLFPLSPWNQQRQYEKPVWVYPAHLAMYATYLRNEGHEVYWQDIKDYEIWRSPFSDIDKRFRDCIDRSWDEKNFDAVIKNDFQIDIPFEKLPYPDRILTDAKNKRWQSYGNYRKHPATHMMVSNLCWYGKCTFCIDTSKLQAGEKRGLRSVDHVMEEIDDLIANGYKEVFDDSGTFPVGSWLEEFCLKMQKRKKHIMLGCNMKPIKLDYKMMANAGFKFMLVGIESANQRTVDKIQKGQRSEDIIPIIKSMSDAGLAPHVTFMSSFPWETKEEEKKTQDLGAYLLKKGYAKTLQASIYCPPRTEPTSDSKGHKEIPKFYSAYRSPQFWYYKFRDLREWSDFTYLMRGARLVIEEKIRKAFR